MVPYPSKLLENAVAEFSKLPGIGRKTALRLCLHLLSEDSIEVEQFSTAITEMRKNIGVCTVCHNLSDNTICDICANTGRDTSTVCVVESIRDIMAIENTTQYKGVYHVLGGKISPIEGIGPNDLNIASLDNRLSKGGINEIILALPATLEGDTTNYYLFKKMSVYPIQFSTIARGVAVGDELEYTDEVTLGRSIIHRTPYETTGRR